MVLLVAEQVLIFSVGVHIGTEHDWKLKFSMQPGIYLTHLNTIFENYHVFSEFRSCRCFLFKRCKCIYPVLKNKPLLFSLKKSLLVSSHLHF